LEELSDLPDNVLPPFMIPWLRAKVPLRCTALYFSVLLQSFNV
jgi:hypothetical protein